MSNGYPKAIVFLEKPVRIGDADYSVIYCQPQRDISSPLSGVSNTWFLIDLGYNVNNIGISTPLSNITAIVYETADAAIDGIIGSFDDYQGFVDLT